MPKGRGAAAKSLYLLVLSVQISVTWQWRTCERRIPASHDLDQPSLGLFLSHDLELIKVACRKIRITAWQGSFWRAACFCAVHHSKNMTYDMLLDVLCAFYGGPAYCSNIIYCNCGSTVAAPSQDATYCCDRCPTFLVRRLIHSPILIDFCILSYLMITNFSFRHSLYNISWVC